MDAKERPCILRQKLFIAATTKEVKDIIASIRKLGASEIKNAEKALKIVSKDSSLGFEPSMGYAAGKEYIEWKIRQVNHMLTHELAVYEKGLQF